MVSYGWIIDKKIFSGAICTHAHALARFVFCFRFTCYFGANIRTVIVAAQAFAVIGFPLLLPTFIEVR